MKLGNVMVGLALAGICVLALAAQSGCSPDFFLNLIAERAGQFTVIFINDTAYRASFSYGSWDAMDRNPPGPLEFRQRRLEAHDTAGPTAISCARNFAIGTQDFYDRAVYHEVNLSSTFDADAFNVVVNFSDAPADSDLAAAATVGTALGTERLLAVDYNCGDQVIFTFVQDPDATGGFRIDYAVLETPDE
ncbi:MAG: hypothetical protein ABIG44_05420 [Planctomycetota bacterium]